MIPRSPLPADLPGAMVISLDFELAWGVRDRAGSRERILGARSAVPRILELFEELEIAATWATVGFLFAASRSELLDLAPNLRPDYQDPGLSPYEDEVGEDEDEDPLRFAGSLIDRIRSTPYQEIATHTFSHYYCGEAGQDREAFRADLKAAIEVASRRGLVLKSIVFPRNQHNPEYDQVLLDLGISAFRGNPRSFGWRFSGTDQSRGMAKRAARLLDGYLGWTGPGTQHWSQVLQPNGLADVRASYPLRPYNPGLKSLDPLRFRRIRRSLRHAAAHGELFHLWWHPHNFGLHTAKNLSFLRRVLEAFRDCAAEYGMVSLTMADVEAMARTHGEVGEWSSVELT